MRGGMLHCRMDAGWMLAGIGIRQTVAVLASLGHHRFVVPETELSPEIRKTGHCTADLAVANCG
jgi:hypothetical protein